MSENNQKFQKPGLNEFFSQHSVFTIEELDDFLSNRDSLNINTRKSLLSYYCKKDRIINIRRGLYATVPIGKDPSSYPVDPYLVAAKMSQDAVLAYHTALEFHGKAHTPYNRIIYVSNKKSVPLKFQKYEIKGVVTPNPLQIKKAEMFGVFSLCRSGVELKVTDLERAFVDVLDRPNISGSWEEIWRSLESIEFFDLEKILKYLYLLENSTTSAKVGLFLEKHKDALMVDDAYLAQIQKLCPRRAHYITGNKRSGCSFVKEWNLMVPEVILTRSWEE